MPYFTIFDLPESIQAHLPKRAQEIYRRAFNKVWDTHYDPASLPKGETRVSLAAKIAWHAVKEEYRKWGTRWVQRHDVEHPKIVPKTVSRFHKKKKS